MYFASFDIAGSEIAVFRTKTERDRWVSQADFFNRIPVSEEYASMFEGNPIVKDLTGVKWLLTRC